jgi:predicted nucleic acid-binding protein
MIIDRIVETAGLVQRIQRAIANGPLTIVETHLLRDQLSQTPNAARRILLFRVYDALPMVAVPTSEFVLDVSRFDDAEFGDESVDLEGLATAGCGRMQDALLASTASRKADIIVTEDGDLRKKVEAGPSFVSRQTREAAMSPPSFAYPHTR